MSNNTTCSICLELLLGGPAVGTVVSCGHCFHEDCFRGWEASRTGRNNRKVKCPNCNTISKSFVKLFLEQAAETNHNNNNNTNNDDDDDLSLGSISTADSALKNAIENPTTERQDTSNNSNEDGTLDEIQNDRDENDEHSAHDPIIDLTHSSSVEPQITTNSFAHLDGSNHHDDKSNNNSLRYLKLAKKYKRRMKQLQLQFDEWKNRHMELQSEREALSDKYESTKQTLNEVERRMAKDSLELDQLRLESLKSTRERSQLRMEFEVLNKRYRSAMEEFQEKERMFAHQLDNARASNMAEVQELLKDGPKLVEENAKLKQQLQTWRFKCTCSRPTSMLPLSSSSKAQGRPLKRTKHSDVAKSLRSIQEMGEEDRSLNDYNKYSTSRERTEPKQPSHPSDSRKYSMQAVRMAAAIQKKSVERNVRVHSHRQEVVPSRKAIDERKQQSSLSAATSVAAAAAFRSTSRNSNGNSYRGTSGSTPVGSFKTSLKLSKAATNRSSSFFLKR